MMMAYSRIFRYTVFLVLCFAVFSGGSLFSKDLFAQENDPRAALNAVDDSLKEEEDKVSANEVPSLFFTYWQHKTIRDAKNSRGVVRAPDDWELDVEEDYEPDPGPREVLLGGILYNGEKNWTIWLNGQRVTPDAVPKEVLDLRVYDDFIEVKWLDEYTNQIFPLRLRAHQRFNLDMRIFLPG